MRLCYMHFPFRIRVCVVTFGPIIERRTNRVPTIRSPADMKCLDVNRKIAIQNLYVTFRLFLRSVIRSMICKFKRCCLQQTSLKALKMSEQAISIEERNLFQTCVCVCVCERVKHARVQTNDRSVDKLQVLVRQRSSAER